MKSDGGKQRELRYAEELHHKIHGTARKELLFAGFTIQHSVCLCRSNRAYRPSSSVKRWTGHFPLPVSWLAKFAMPQRVAARLCASANSTHDADWSYALGWCSPKIDALY